MSKPNQTQDMKPKVNDDLVKVPIDNSIKLVIVNILSTLLVCILFIGVNYLLQDNLLTSKLKNITESEASETEDAPEEEIQKGIILDLGDFILNLADPGQRKYLKVNVALELSKTATDPDLNPPAAASGGHGGGHGAPAPVDPMKQIEQEMAQYKPAIRDAVITNFSSKTSDEVLTGVGKEMVKEQITESVNAIFAGEREVIRVSFGQFIIQ